MDGRVLEDLHTAGARMLKQRGVKEIAADSNCRERQGDGDGMGFCGGEQRPVDLVMRYRTDLPRYAHSFQHWPAVGIDHVTANLATRESGAFEEGDP